MKYPDYDSLTHHAFVLKHFINAVVQLDSTRLAKVAVIRLAAPYTTECPPVNEYLALNFSYGANSPQKFIDFPVDLKNIVNGHTAIIQGGLQMWVS